MAYGMRVWNASGSLVWDTTTAADGCVIDLRTVPANTSATYTYPAMAGRTVAVRTIANQSFFVTGTNDPGDGGITTDTTLGYPRVIVASAGYARTFMVIADY